MSEEKIRRGRKRLASEIQRICPSLSQAPAHMDQVADEAEDDTTSNGPDEVPPSPLDSLLERKLSEQTTSSVTKAELISLRLEIRQDIKAVDERLSRRLEELARNLDAHMGVCKLLQASGNGVASNGGSPFPHGSVLPHAHQLPLSLPLPPAPTGPPPREATPPSPMPHDDPWAKGLLDGAKVSPFSGNDSATSEGSSGSGAALGSSPLAATSLPPLSIRPQRRSQSREAPKPLIMSDYAKYNADGTDPLVFPHQEEEERWRKMTEAGTAPQLPTSYCWSMLRGRLGVEGLVHPSLTKSEACPPNSSLKDLLRRQSNVIAQALILTLKRYSKPDATEADTRQLARNIMRQVIKNVNTLRTSYKHIAMRQQMEEDVAKMDNVASAFQKLRQHYFTSQGFSLAHS